MTTGIPLIQPAPARVASQVLGAQLSPSGARLDAPEPRTFEQSLRDEQAAPPREEPVTEERVERPSDDPPENGGGVGADADPGEDAAIEENTSGDTKPGGGPIDEEPTRPDASDSPEGGDDAEDKKRAAAKQGAGVEGPASAGPGGGNGPTGGEGIDGAPTNGAGSQQGATAGVDRPVSPNPPATPDGGQPSAGRPDSATNPGQTPGAGAFEPDNAGVARPTNDDAGVPIRPGRGETSGARLAGEPAPPTDGQIRLRFDESVRAQVKRPARIDLDQLAAEQLTTPTRGFGSGSRVDAQSGRAWWGESSTDNASGEPARQATESRETVSTRALPIQAPAAESTPQNRQPAAAGDRLSGDQPGAVSGAQGGNESQSQGRQAGGEPRPGVAAPTTAPTRVVADPGAAAAFRVQLQNTAGVGEARGVPRIIDARGVDKAGSPPPGSRAARGEAAGRVLAQVSRGVASVLRQRGGSLTLRLTPRSLGELKINLRLEGGGVNASFKAGGAQARELLQNNLDSLRQTLEQHGVRVERLSVEGEHDGARDAPHARAEDPRDRGWESARREGQAESGGDGRSPGDERHGGRAGDDAGGESRAHDGRGQGAGGAAEREDAGLIGVGALGRDGLPGLDTLA